MAKKKDGRPTIYKDELAYKICEKLSEGISLKKTCEELEIGYSTVRQWLIDGDKEDFQALSARAKEIGRDALGDDCIAIADDPKLTPNDKRIRIDTRLRLLGKWDPAKWGDKTQLTGADGRGPVQVKNTTTIIFNPVGPDGT